MNHICKTVCALSQRNTDNTSDTVTDVDFNAHEEGALKCSGRKILQRNQNECGIEAYDEALTSADRVVTYLRSKAALHMTRQQKTDLGKVIDQILRLGKSAGVKA
jgi:hypothetical protein